MKSLWLAMAALVLLETGCAAGQLMGTAAQPESSVANAPPTQSPAVQPPAVQPPAQQPVAVPPAGPDPRVTQPEQAGSGLQQTTAFTTDPAKPVPIQGQVTCRVRAVVNGVAILDDELRQAAYGELAIANTAPEPERTARLKEIIRRELEKLIERELILKEAQNVMEKRPQAWKKLQEFADKEFDKSMRSYKERLASQGVVCENEDKLKEVLMQQGLTIEGLKRQIERNFMAMEYMRHMIYPLVERIGHQEIKEYYDQHPGEFQLEDRVRWQDIFVNASKFPNPQSARRFAEEIARAARMGDDFARLCEMYDDGDSRYRKGDGCGAKHGEIRPVEAEPYLFQMQESDIGPIVEIPTGFHVFRLVERQYPGLQPFDDKTQALIKKKLSAVIMEREYKRTLNEMKRRAVIQIIDSDL
jgi:peptidyl-prolyl cis-trans isomerase SurA